MMTREESLEMAAATEAIAMLIRPLLADHPAPMQGAVLARLLATWLAGHRLPNGKEGDLQAFHEELIVGMLKTVRDLVPIEEEEMNAKLFDELLRTRQ
jgi:hypothetical protein